MGLFDGINLFGSDDEEDDNLLAPVTVNQPSVNNSPVTVDSEYDRIMTERAGAVQPESGVLGDIGRGILSGVMRGTEAVAEAGQWFAPEGTPFEMVSKETKDFLKGVREDNPAWFTESKASEAARNASAWNPRGWLYGGMESLGMLVPGAVAGMATGGVGGIATIGGQFWGSTAQQAYDEAVENEKKGTGTPLTENEKVLYANLRGFWEGGMEAVQAAIPFGKLGKFIPKPLVNNLIVSAVKQSGNPLFNFTKNLLKVTTEEVGMELFQEYVGQKTAFEMGQSDTDPGWDDIKGVIGPTIIVSAVLGTSAYTGDARQRRRLYDALTNPDTGQRDRVAAAEAVYLKVKSEDPELADMWAEMVKPALEQNKPVALPLDEDVRNPKNLDELKSKLQEDVTVEQVKVSDENRSPEEQIRDTGLPGFIKPSVTPVADQVESQKEIKSIDNQIRRINTWMKDTNLPKSPEKILTAQKRIAELEQQKREISASVQKQPVAVEDTSSDKESEKIAVAVKEAATSPENNLPEPTENQQEAGNYKKAHIRVQGMDISIENPDGSVRSGVDSDGETWQTKMVGHYGYVRRTEGKDGDQVDVFVNKDYKENVPVFVIDQVNPDTGAFDEHKAMIGYENAEQAKQAYLDNYEPGWKGLGAVTEMSVQDFKDWSTSDMPSQGALNLPETSVSQVTEKPSPVLSRAKSDGKIPELTSTGAAVDFGNQASPQQVQQLTAKYEAGIRQVQELMAAGKTGPAMELAQKNQFYREAREVAMGTPLGEKLKAKRIEKENLRKKEHKAVTALREDVKKAISKLPPGSPPVSNEIEQVELTDARSNTLRKLAKKFGKDVVFFKGDFARGAVVPWLKDTILINENQKADSLFILGHEMLHTLKIDRPDLYKQFGEAVAGGVKDYQKYANDYRADIPGAKDAEIVEELLADFSGEQFTDPEFWRKIRKERPALFDKIADILTKLFNKIGDITGVYFAQLRTAQDALVSVMKEYTAEESRKAEKRQKEIVDRKLFDNLTKTSYNKTGSGKEIRHEQEHKDTIDRKQEEKTRESLRSQKGDGRNDQSRSKLSEIKPVSVEEFVAERNKSSRPEFLTPYTPAEMTGWKTYLSADGVGYALTDKLDIVGVFNNSGRRGAGVNALVEAIAAGGKTLDCIDGHLDTYYRQFGFELKERVNWDDQYAPRGWNYEKYGRPTVSFWQYPEGLSREKSDVRRRFESAQRQGTSVSGYERTSELRNPQYDGDIAAAQSGMDQKEQNQADRGTEASGGNVKFSRASKINTPEFKRWFGDSKVVDENGEPLVVYHGTKNDFLEIDPGFSADIGVHFGTEEQADIFIKDGGKKFKVHLNIKNPLELDFDPTVLPQDESMFADGDYFQNHLKRIASEFGIYDFYAAIRGGNKKADAALTASEKADKEASEWIEYGDIRELFNNKVVKNFWKKLEALIISNGFDGVIYENEIEGPGTSYIVFKKEQIHYIDNQPVKADPDIRYSRSRPPRTIGKKFQTTVYDSPMESAMKAFDTAIGHMNKESLTSGLDWMRTQLIDRYNPVKKQLGEDIYKLHKLLNNSAATTGAFLQHGPMKWDSGAISINTKNKGFVPWLKSIGEEGKYFLHWVAAKRSQQLYLEGRENWIEPQEAVDIMNEATGGNPAVERKFEKYADKLQEFNKNVLDVAEEAGLIDPESRAKWETHYYIPFYRVLENEDTGEDFLKAPVNTKKFLSAGIKKLKGGESLLGDPMENLLHNWAHLINQAQLNMARRAAGQLMFNIGIAQEMKASDLSKIVGVVRKFDVKDSNGEIDATFTKKGDADAHAALIKGTVHSFTSINRKALEDVKILSYQENGKPVYIKPDDLDLFNALSHLNTQMLDNWVSKLLSGSKRLLTAGATFGAGFRIANAIRDTLHTAIVSKNFIPVIDTARGLMQVWQKSDDYIRLMASGGGFSQGYLDSGDPKALARSIKKITKTEGPQATNFILDTPKKLLAFWERVGHASEMAARTQLYTNLKKAGKTHMEAAYEARDLLDFASSGQSNVIRMATSMIPFLNARLQGLDRLSRGFGANPVAFALKGLAVSAASLALWAMYKDDDRYKDLEDYDKWQYHHFWIGDTHYRIPKAFEVGAIFATTVESVANALSGEEDFKFVMDMVKHTVTQTFALGAPALLSPAAELWANKSFFTGREIESEWMQKLPPDLRYKPWTPEVLKEMGKVLGVSPVKLESLIRGYMATFGTMFLSMTDMALSFSPNSIRPRESFTEFSGMSRFAKTRPENIKQTTRFYEFADEAEKVFNAVKVYQDTGDIEEAKKMIKAHPDYQARQSLASLTNSQLTGIRAREKFIWNNKTMAQDEKKRQLDLLKMRKNEIYKKAYEQIRKFK